MVVKCGVSPEYFLDEMSEKETESLLKTHNEVYREEAEERRWLAYVIAQSLTGGYQSPMDLRKYPWDIEQVADEEEIKRRQEFLTASVNNEEKVKFNPFKK